MPFFYHGEPIPVCIVLNTLDSDKIIVADIIDLDRDEVFQAGINIPNILPGVYSTNAINGPNVNNLKIVASVFEQDGITPNLNGPQKYSDIFNLTKPQRPGRIAFKLRKSAPVSFRLRSHAIRFKFNKKA